MSLNEILSKTKASAKKLAISGAEERKNILNNIALLLNERRQEIINVNKIDIDNADKSGLSSAMIDRLRLTNKEIDGMIKAVNEISMQNEVIGDVIGGSTRPNGLKIRKVRVPLGVVGIIYESRPNVTIDSAALCIKSGNGAVLRGGKEAINSNKILAEIIAKSLEIAGFSKDVIYFIDDTDRNIIKEMAQAKGLIDVIIPRGGEGLINFVVENARIPVIMHDKGVCHVFIDESAEYQQALSITFNAKVQRPSACNAMETLLVHKNIAPSILPDIAEMLQEVDVDLRGCEETLKYVDCRPAIEEDYYTEYHDMILSIKVVENIDEAVAHINKYGSGHSEAIVTKDYNNSEKFLNEVDAAAVYVNASTRFTDGGEFGLGAEIGISTQKLHVRGPMGAADLTTTKYLIYGSGQLRG
ncbi:MAG TPA: glutamate-5-semialdehyde dehydrogenase [Candidatus Mucispirillum faecigallinarum]|uniref:Gamma-glutamyl phosphate reductase n=1 Tax=Candidatus Mucispirillum faecigallinarum TaxID=2838699 RepID=A0A9D2GWR5_9BACT|nr:glutamate-5-semialdehyde dehydrogenase [Candidatus Mucispirillum faecigallinarum]